MGTTRGWRRRGDPGRVKEAGSCGLELPCGKRALPDKFKSPEAACVLTGESDRLLVALVATPAGAARDDKGPFEPRVADGRTIEPSAIAVLMGLLPLPPCASCCVDDTGERSKHIAAAALFVCAALTALRLCRN